jgi:hypothetical protein
VQSPKANEDASAVSRVDVKAVCTRLADMHQSLSRLDAEIKADLELLASYDDMSWLTLKICKQN